VLLAGARERDPLGPGDTFLTFDHEAEVHERRDPSGGVLCASKIVFGGGEAVTRTSLRARWRAPSPARQRWRSAPARRRTRPVSSSRRPTRTASAGRAARTTHQLRDAALVARMITTPQAGVVHLRHAARGPEGRAQDMRQARGSTRCRRSSPTTCPTATAASTPRGRAQHRRVPQVDRRLRRRHRRRKANVILDPTGSGSSPTTSRSTAPWTGASPRTSRATRRRRPTRARFAALNGAVDRLGEQPASALYLDGTHSAMARRRRGRDRLLKAGVEPRAGFFVNAPIIGRRATRRSSAPGSRAASRSPPTRRRAAGGSATRTTARPVQRRRPGRLRPRAGRRHQRVVRGQPRHRVRDQRRS
jgi:hypothetical protein